MNEGAIYTQEEIMTQPDAWQDALNQVRLNLTELNRIRAMAFDQVIFCGCGSTYYLSLAAASLFQELTGIASRAVPAGELMLYPRNNLTTRKTLLVAVSRSGSTTETVRAVEAFKELKLGPVLAVTNYGDQPLAQIADLALVIPKGQEASIAQTRSFASMYVATTAVTAIFAGLDDLFASMNALPSLGAKLIGKYQPFARITGENLEYDRYYFLGSGPRYGLACETNLKMKEMTMTHSEPFHFMEFRHGPMSMVTNTTVIAGFLSESNRIYEQQVLNEMMQLGGKIISLGEMGTDVQFESGLPETLRNVLYLPVLQLMAFYRSKAKGLNPDRPTNLSAVVKLNLVSK